MNQHALRRPLFLWQFVCKASDQWLLVGLHRLRPIRRNMRNLCVYRPQNSKYGVGLVGLRLVCGPKSVLGAGLTCSKHFQYQNQLWKLTQISRFIDRVEGRMAWSSPQANIRLFAIARPRVLAMGWSGRVWGDSPPKCSLLERKWSNYGLFVFICLFL